LDYLFAESSFAESMRTISLNLAALVLSASAVATTSFAQEMHNHSGSPVIVGSVTFPISCSKQAQQDVERGLAMFHSFLFDDAESQFQAAAEADPRCAMAYWGEAIGLYRPLAYLPSAADLKRGWELVQKAEQLAAKTPREQDHVEAAEILYRPDARNYVARNHEYSAQLEKIYKAYPDDTEAAVFYALSVLTFADSGHPIEDSEKTIAILNPVFAQHPDHPGVAHYIIHAADNPQLASQGLEAARHYAQIAPAAPHALHMPSHIFARLGLWQEDIQSNLASLHAAQRASAVHIGGENLLHAMEFLEYAYLQVGEDDKAKEMVESQRKISYDQVDPNLHDYVNRTFANSPALYALETRNWKAAEGLKSDPAAEPYNQAIIYWAQAVAAGHLHDLAVAQNAVAEYDAMLELTKQGPKPRIAKFMMTRHDEARAWLLLLQGRDKEATELLRALADKQDAEGKGEIETPAREMFADMLMELHRPAQALVEYEKSMTIDPNRFNGLYGAGHAAERTGQKDKEKIYYSQLLKNCADAQSMRAELRHAEQVLRVGP
jgi:tetratricopeptide (TPR) repeat protein